jgi:glucose/mannose transport system substrate-binding protein
VGIRWLVGAGLCSAIAVAHAAPPRAEVIHWWTSGGEADAVRSLASAYRAAGGTWVDSAIAGAEQARSVAINRIVGGNPPTAAQFNTTRQYLDFIDQGMLADIDEVAVKEGWDRLFPEPVLAAVRVHGHFYAAPVSIHMPAWFWFSKAAFRRAGIASEPRSVDELFADLDRLRAAGLIPLAHGGQGWQENIVFVAMLANVGGRELYLKVLRDRDPAAIASAPFRRVLLAYKRLQSYVDAGSPGRNWNDATALLITGRAGVQIMGDWVKGEFTHAKLEPGRDYGCSPGFGPAAPYIVQGDAMVFPRSGDAQVVQAQRLLAHVILDPKVQREFAALKGSVPARNDVDVSTLDACARLGAAALRDRARQVGNGEMFMTPDQNGALSDVLTAYWNRDTPVEKVQRDVAAALRD